MNRLQEVCTSKDKLLSLFFAAGFPTLNAMPDLVLAAAAAGADFIEVGFPFSDSLVDGPYIQACNTHALAHGMKLDSYFNQILEIRSQSTIPLVFMGTCNVLFRKELPVFLKEAVHAGIDAMILPDLPPEEYAKHYRHHFEAAGCGYIPLVTRYTSNERVCFLDELAGGFLYCVSMSGTTGGGFEADDTLRNRMLELQALNLRNKLVLGFGIQNPQQFKEACSLADGGIIGTAVLRGIADAADRAPEYVHEFVTALRNGS